MKLTINLLTARRLRMKRLLAKLEAKYVTPMGGQQKEKPAA